MNEDLVKKFSPPNREEKVVFHPDVAIVPARGNTSKMSKMKIFVLSLLTVMYFVVIFSADGFVFIFFLIMAVLLSIPLLASDPFEVGGYEDQKFLDQESTSSNFHEYSTGSFFDNQTSIGIAFDNE
jgi:hypothetical protein